MFVCACVLICLYPHGNNTWFSVCLCVCVFVQCVCSACVCVSPLLSPCRVKSYAVGLAGSHRQVRCWPHFLWPTFVQGGGLRSWGSHLHTHGSGSVLTQPRFSWGPQAVFGKPPFKGIPDLSMLKLQACWDYGHAGQIFTSARMRLDPMITCYSQVWDWKCTVNAGIRYNTVLPCHCFTGQTIQ